MMKRESKDDLLFLQRLDELATRSVERYCPEFTHFLDGRNLRIAIDYLKKYSESVILILFGGFQEYERCVVGMFPRDVYSQADENEMYSMFDVTALKITGSGFSTFSHRDCMGSILALGVKRETMGDIFVSADGRSAYVCLKNVTAKYLVENLEYISRDKIKVECIDFGKLPIVERKFSVITGTVASERLDCIIALATNLSREKSKQLISAGLVNVNHFEETKCDTEICEGDILSVRGYGRYVVKELGGITRKGRNRVIVHKMI